MKRGQKLEKMQPSRYLDLWLYLLEMMNCVICVFLIISKLRHWSTQNRLALGYSPRPATNEVSIPLLASVL